MPNTIAQNLTRLANAKEAIAEAIEAKGVTLGENDGFEDFADAIMEISGGGTIETKVKLLKSIKSEGNSVIRTDIILQFTDEVHMSVKFSGTRQSSSATDCFFGIQGSNPWYLAANPSGQDCSVFIGYDYTQTPLYLSNSIELNTIIPIILRRTGSTIIGTDSGTISTAIAGDPHDFGCSFFGVSGPVNSSRFNYYNLTLYEAKIISNSGSIIHHLTPAEDQTTHRGGLYDLITGKFYPTHEDYDDVIKEEGASEIPYVNAQLITKNIITNGTYSASTDDADGYSSVTVNIPNKFNATVTLENGGYTGAAILNGILKPDNGAQVSTERCRGANIVFLPAGTYQINKTSAADDDIQFNISQHYLGINSSSDNSYVFCTSALGSWGNTPATITMSTAGYISILVRKENNATITPTSAGNYVIIKEV